jgi:hypothetical protein
MSTQWQDDDYNDDEDEGYRDPPSEPRDRTAEALEDLESQAEQIKDSLARLSAQATALDTEREDRERTREWRDAINEKRAQAKQLREQFAAERAQAKAGTEEGDPVPISPRAARLQAEGVLLELEVAQMEARLPFAGLGDETLEARLEDAQVRREETLEAEERLPKDSARRRRLEGTRRQALIEIEQIKNEMQARKMAQWVEGQKAEHLERRAREWLTAKATEAYLRAGEDRVESWQLDQARAAVNAVPTPEDVAAAMAAIKPAVDREVHEMHLRSTLSGDLLPAGPLADLPPSGGTATVEPPWAPRPHMTTKDLEDRLARGEITVPEAMEHFRLARAERERERNVAAMRNTLRIGKG